MNTSEEWMQDTLWKKKLNNENFIWSQNLKKKQQSEWKRRKKWNKWKNKMKNTDWKK